MNVNLFKFYAAENGDRMQDIAAALGKSVATVSAKLHGKAGDFSRRDIVVLKKRWNLTLEQCSDIFLS